MSQYEPQKNGFLSCPSLNRSDRKHLLQHGSLDCTHREFIQSIVCKIDLLTWFIKHELHEQPLCATQQTNEMTKCQIRFTLLAFLYWHVNQMLNPEQQQRSQQNVQMIYLHAVGFFLPSFLHAGDVSLHCSSRQEETRRARAQSARTSSPWC